MLKIIDPASEKLGVVLTNLRNPNVMINHVIQFYCCHFQLLWTQYGLRSLAKTDPLYHKVSYYGNTTILSLVTMVAQHRA